MSRKSVLITRTVWLVSWVSLFTDISSEMLYPVMPAYLQTIGFTALGIGLLEGLAEAIVSWSKGYFGFWSDASGKRMPFVRIGYLLSALGKGMLLLGKMPLLIFLSRSADRFGKGIRSAPRDAVLVSESKVEHRGTVFGFHRAMDTVGASIGPLMAMLCLWYYPGNYTLVFTVALAPACISVLLTWLIAEPPSTPIVRQEKPVFTYVAYWRAASPLLKKVFLGLLVFALANSSDLFLLMRAKSMGWSDSGLIGLYVLYNLTYAALSYPVGKLADRRGMAFVNILGLLCFIIVYAGFAFANDSMLLLPLLLVYGLFAACSEGMAKAWISKLVGKEEMATSLGFFAGINGLAALLASSLTGWLWVSFSPTVALSCSAVLSLLALLWMWMIKNTSKKLVAKA